MSNGTIARYRFNRVGDVVRDERTLGVTVGTDKYQRGDLLFRPRRSSGARHQFRAQRRERRSAKRAA